MIYKYDSSDDIYSSIDEHVIEWASLNESDIGILNEESIFKKAIDSIKKILRRIVDFVRSLFSKLKRNNKNDQDCIKQMDNDIKNAARNQKDDNTTTSSASSNDSSQDDSNQTETDDSNPMNSTVNFVKKKARLHNTYKNLEDACVAGYDRGFELKSVNKHVLQNFEYDIEDRCDTLCTQIQAVAIHQIVDAKYENDGYTTAIGDKNYPTISEIIKDEITANADWQCFVAMLSLLDTRIPAQKALSRQLEYQMYLIKDFINDCKERSAGGRYDMRTNESSFRHSHISLKDSLSALAVVLGTSTDDPQNDKEFSDMLHDLIIDIDNSYFTNGKKLVGRCLDILKSDESSSIQRMLDSTQKLLKNAIDECQKLTDEPAEYSYTEKDEKYDATVTRYNYNKTIEGRKLQAITRLSNYYASMAQIVSNAVVCRKRLARRVICTLVRSAYAGLSSQNESFNAFSRVVLV